MKTHKLLLALIGTLIVGTGSAQTWTVNGVTQGTQLNISSTESAVSIDPVSGAVALKTAGVVTVPTVTVSAPASAGFGQNFSVSWSTTGFTGTISCTASASTSVAGWNGTITGTPVQVTAPSTTQQLTLTLQCTGSNGNATGSTVVSVSDANCRLPGYKRDEFAPFIPFFVQPAQYGNFFGQPFPGFNALHLGSLGAGSVIATEFLAPASTATDGYYEITTLASGPGTPITSISKCPGDMDYRLNTENGGTRLCMKVGNEGGPQWTVNQSQQLSVIRCVLTPGTRYYLNIAFETCEGSEGCIFRIASRDITARGDQETLEAQQNQGK